MRYTSFLEIYTEEEGRELLKHAQKIEHDLPEDLTDTEISERIKEKVLEQLRANNFLISKEFDLDNKTYNNIRFGFVKMN